MDELGEGHVNLCWALLWSSGGHAVHGCRSWEMLSMKAAEDDIQATTSTQGTGTPQVPGRWCSLPLPPSLCDWG